MTGSAHASTPFRSSKASAFRLGLTLSCAVSVLAACGQSGSTTGAVNTIDNTLADAPPPATALPLATGPAPAYNPAPPANALPPAPRVRLARAPEGEQYAYLNQAYAFSRSLADAPPDYGYDYQGEEPWVWQSPDGYYRVAERLPRGVRYFYYAPGASTPYLIQDPQYSYAYSQGYLTAVYGPNGELAPSDVEAQQASAAGLYLAWAEGLYAAARRQEHVAIAQSYWDANRQAVYADEARWSAGQQQNQAWAAYSQAHQSDQAHWAAQRYMRAAEAARFAQAVNDQAALAHAQQAAMEASAVAQAHGERLPGPPPGESFAHREGGNPAIPAAGVAAVGAAAAVGLVAAHHQQALQRQAQPAEPPRPQYQAQDRPGAQTRAGAQPERPGAPPVAAEARAQQVAQTREAQVQAAQTQAAQAKAAQARAVQANAAEARQTQAREQQAAARQGLAAEAAQRAAAERAQAESRSRAVAQARPQAQTQAAEVRRAPPAPPHPDAARPAPAPHPATPPEKPRPEDRRPT